MEIKNITKAIIKVMGEVNNIEKNTTVGTGKSSYSAVSDKDVKQAIRTSMIKNGLSILQTGIEGNIRVDRWEAEETWNGKTSIKTKQSVFTDVTTKYLLLHESGESIDLAGYGQGVDSQDKGAGKATTYALKNTLINIFLVPTGEDTDNTHSNDIATPQKAVKSTGIYIMTKKDVENWAGKIYGKTVYINGEKKNISDEQIEKLKKHPKYMELPDKRLQDV